MRPAVGHLVQTGVGGVQKAGHFLGGFALDAHGQAEGANLEVGDGAVQHLAEQIGGLLAGERAGAVFAAADFLDVVTDAHGSIVSELI